MSLIVLLVAVGCGGGGGSYGGNGSTGLTNSQLAGTWKTVSIRTAAGQQANCPASFTLAPTVFLECTANDTTTFGADGSISDSGGATFTVSGNRITINSPASGNDAAFSSVFVASLAGNQLTLTQVSSTSPDPTLGSDYNGTTTVSQKQ